MIDKRCFLQWFVLSLAYTVAAFFAWRYGLLQAVWAGDITCMTSVIAAMFVGTCLYQGFASWRFDGHKGLDRVIADIGIGRAAGFLVTLVGLLGTAIGLMVQVRAMGSVNVNDPASIVAFISTIGVALSTALYATSCGIIACIGITILNGNLEFFVDRTEAELQHNKSPVSSEGDTDQGTVVATDGFGKSYRGINFAPIVTHTFGEAA